MKSVFPAETKANLLSFDAVMAHVKRICVDEGYDSNDHKSVSKALTLFALMSNFDGLAADDAWECIVDGTNDHGIDAIYIEDDENGKSVVHIFQTKAYSSREKILEKKFSGNDLDKLINKFDDLIVQRKFHEQTNEHLKRRLQEVYSLTNPEYRLGIITTGLPPSIDAAERFIEKIESYNRTASFVGGSFIGLDDLASFLPVKSEPRIDVSLRLEGKYVEAKAGRANVLIGRVQGRSLAELVRSHGDKLFQKNVRGFLKLRKNSINENIYNSATSDEESSYFFILNNGVTIVCDRLRYMSGQESPEVEISGAQIVNGGQTSNTLYQALYDDKLQPSVNVLVRIIESDEPGIVDRIAKATNRQNAVYDRDLRSNDDIQKTIKSFIKDTYGFYYESRKNEYEGKGIPVGKRVDALKAAQAYYAYYEQVPALAKTGKSKLFNQYYDLIFNSENDRLPEQIFFAHQLLDAVEGLKANFIERYAFTRDALITILALLKTNSSIRTIEALKEDEKNDYQILSADVERIMKATAILVQNEAERLGSGFEKRRLFIAPSTVVNIAELIRK